MRTADMRESEEQEIVFHSRTPTGFGSWLHETVPDYGYFTTVEPPRYFNAAIFYDGVEDEDAVLVTDQELDLHYSSYAKRMNFAHSLDLQAIHHESRRKIDLIKAVVKLQQVWKAKLSFRGFYLLPKQRTPKKPRECDTLSKKPSRPVFASNFSETLAAGESTPHSVSDIAKRSLSPIPKDIEILGSVKHGSPRDRSLADQSILDVEEPEFKVSPRLRDMSGNANPNQVSKSQYSFALRSVDRQVIGASVQVDQMQANELSQAERGRESGATVTDDQPTIKRSYSMMSMKSDSLSALSEGGPQRAMGAKKSNAIRFKSNLSKSQKELSPVLQETEPAKYFVAEQNEPSNFQLEELKSKLDTSIREEGLLGEAADFQGQAQSPFFNLLDNNTMGESPMKSVEVLRELSRTVDSIPCTHETNPPRQETRPSDSFMDEEPLSTAPKAHFLEKCPENRIISQPKATVQEPHQTPTNNTSTEQDFKTGDSARSDCDQSRSHLKSKTQITSSFKKKPRPAVSSTTKGHIEVVFEEQESRKSQEPRSLAGKSNGRSDPRGSQTTNTQGIPLINPRGSTGAHATSNESGLSSAGLVGSNRKYLPNLRPETQLSPKTSSGRKMLEARKAVLREKSPNSVNKLEIRGSNHSMLGKSTDKKSIVSASKKSTLQQNVGKAGIRSEEAVVLERVVVDQSEHKMLGEVCRSEEKVSSKLSKTKNNQAQRFESNSSQKENMGSAKHTKPEVVPSKPKPGVSSPSHPLKSTASSSLSRRSRLSSGLESDSECGGLVVKETAAGDRSDSKCQTQVKADATDCAQRNRCQRCDLLASSSFFKSQSVQTDPINLDTSTNLGSDELASMAGQAKTQVAGEMANQVDARCLWMAQQIQVERFDH